MLEYQEELELSDRLVERRTVKEQLEQTGKKPGKKEREIIEAGDEAASDLVEHYLPKIRAVASTIMNRSTNTSSADIGHDELVQEGVVAAMSCTNSFNARGKTKGHPGVRFGTYCHMALSKAMNRHIARMSTMVRVDVNVIQESWVWLSVKEEMRIELGREPTTEELEERTNINADYVQEQIPHRSSMQNLDDPDAYDVGDPRRQMVQIQRDYENGVERITQVLEQVYNAEIVKMISLYMGFDRGYPRAYDDLADDLGISKRAARTEIQYIESVLVHPKFRIKLRNAIRDLGEELVDHSFEESISV